MSAVISCIASAQTINTHEHIQSEAEAPKLLAVMDDLGIERTVLVGSSWFTITLNEDVGFTRYDENNEALLRIVERWPGRFEAWPTVTPEDPDMLSKFQSLVERGATGLKLYLGHGYRTKRTGAYFFHTRPLDDPAMLPLYAFCEERFIPVCFHVNPGPKTPGFAKEFIAVLKQFPDLKVICPHFMLSSIKDSRLREFLDTFPNLYTDISFGHDDYLKAGLQRVSRDPDKFRALFADYPDRFLFGTDCVITAYAEKDEAWIRARYQSYLDLLGKATYHSPVLPGQTLNGLNLPPDLLNRILRENYLAFQAKKPTGADIARPIDWDRMGLK
ncbi:MAG: hypothetical protein AMXMBFR82_48060 [Candidatus Hydrogenedentota bacterium]